MSRKLTFIKNFVRSFLPHAIRRWGKRLLRSEYRHYDQSEEDYKQKLIFLGSMPRYTPCKTDILGPNLYIVDAATFLPMYEEIFNNGVYNFRSKTEKPLILDGGANIGLGTIYLKRLYPDCRIIAFEPDANIFAALCRNIQSFGLTNVESINKALWSSETQLEFFAEGSDSGRLVLPDAVLPTTQVNTVRLRDYLNQQIDFLKIDIEGAETEVLLDCKGLLGNVQTIFVEYHSFAGEEQTLPILLQLLKDSGFRFIVHCPFLINPTPLFERFDHNGMDFCANIYAFRE